MQLCVGGPKDVKNIKLCFHKVVKEYCVSLKTQFLTFSVN